MTDIPAGDRTPLRMAMRGPQLARDNIFRLDDPGNRDRCFEPFALLQSEFLQRGIELHTADFWAGRAPDLELHLQARRSSSARAYLIMMETHQIYPPHRDERLLARYRRVFTFEDRRVDGRRFVKINVPNVMLGSRVDGWEGRSRFCCVIAGNKSAALDDGRDLYGERVRAIRWFERNAADEFDLFGIGWELPPPRTGFTGRVQQALRRRLPRLAPAGRPFPSYRGRIRSKQEVLAATRFCICYENVRDMPGYITEKIFDCFFAGCVPVYWGADNVTDCIPRECFVDRRQFGDTGEVYAFLKAMSEAQYLDYQRSIAAFLASPAALAFSAETFAHTIADTVAGDAVHAA